MKQKMLTTEQIGSLSLALEQLIHAGIGPADALLLLKQDEEDRLLQQVLQAMADHTDRGGSLASAFREAGCFPTYVCTLLSVGEQVGQTEQTLHALAHYYHGRARLENQLKTALVYPAVLMAVLLTVVTVLLIWVLPIFDDVYAQMGSRLTGFAGILLRIGSVLKQCLPVLALLLTVIGCVAAIGPLRRGFLRFLHVQAGDRGLFARIQNARFMQVLSLGLRSGMEARSAAMLAAELSENPAFQRRCSQCVSSLEEGKSLPKALKDAGILDSSQSRLLEAGIRSGSTDQLLPLLSEQLLDRSEEDLQRAAGRAEPAMVAVACVLIGIVLLSVMLPLMNILNTIG